MSILAIDFGGTRTRAAWYDSELNQLARTETLSRVNDTAEEVITRIIQTAQAVIPPGQQPSSICIAAPGPLDPHRGLIRHAKTLPGWKDIPLVQIIRDACHNAPTIIENDANLAALAEHAYGSARGCDPAIYLTISTGIGGGAIINGKLFTGWSGLAIEPGHTRFTLPDGSIRRLEELASGTGIATLARQRLETSNQPSILRAHTQVDAKLVGEAARNGDALAQSIIREAGHWLGLGCVNLLHLFSPQVIVVGGSVSNLGEIFFGPAQATIAEQILDPAFVPDNLIRPAQLGEDVCLMGAALLARQHISA